jgi:hypothetical protein
VSGDVLRQALLETSSSLGEPFASILGGVDQVEKNQNTIVVTRPAVAEVNVSGARLRMLPELRLSINLACNSPRIKNQSRQVSGITDSSKRQLGAYKELRIGIGWHDSAHDLPRLGRVGVSVGFPCSGDLSSSYLLLSVVRLLVRGDATS